MAGGISAGGLITGLDSGAIIEQLMMLERQPMVRLNTRISALEEQKKAVQSLRTDLLSLRNTAQDFRFTNIFDQFNAASSDEKILTAEVSGENPVVGSYELEVLQLASATVAGSSAPLGSAINPAAALSASGITGEVKAGDFTINGVTFTIDPDVDTLSGVLAQINASSAGVQATYDALTDRVTFENVTPGDTSLINFGGSDDDSNFLDILNVNKATQETGGNGATTATSTRNLGAVNPSESLSASSFAMGAMTAGDFRINGITITVDPVNDSLSDIVGRINNSDAQVLASYDTSSDTIRVVSETLGSRTISFQSGTSNFLDIVNLASATQTAGNDSQFTINGGAVLTRNSNEVSDAIGGVTLDLLAEGTSTVTVNADDDAIVEDMQEFLDGFNGAIDAIRTATASGSALAHDSSLRAIENQLRSLVFSNVTGISGEYNNIVAIGITTGSDFDSGSVSHLQLDEEAFREALREDRANVSKVFTNSGDNGIANIIADYLDPITTMTGFLNQRAKSNGTIDIQIQGLEDQIDRMEERLERRESRLRAQFTRLEQISASYQQQNTSLGALAGGFSLF